MQVWSLNGGHCTLYIFGVQWRVTLKCTVGWMDIIKSSWLSVSDNQTRHCMYYEGMLGGLVCSFVGFELKRNVLKGTTLVANSVVSIVY